MKFTSLTSCHKEDAVKFPTEHFFLVFFPVFFPSVLAVFFPQHTVTKRIVNSYSIYACYSCSSVHDVVYVYVYSINVH
jgi:hypothetical protein